MKDLYPYQPQMPVSAKYYARLCERVRNITSALNRNTGSLYNDVMCLINVHLGIRKNRPASCSQGLQICTIVFESLRAEIDAAMERSRRARARAAARRAAKAAALAGLSDNSDNSDNSDSSEKSDRSELSENSSPSEILDKKSLRIGERKALQCGDGNVLLSLIGAVAAHAQRT